jgi:hypothetical protein
MTTVMSSLMCPVSSFLLGHSPLTLVMSDGLTFSLSVIQPVEKADGTSSWVP